MAASGALLLQATGSAAERTLPLGVIGQLLHGVESASPDSRSLMKLLEETRLRFGSAAGELSALCRAVLALARERPLVLLIDDIHHGDPASQEFLRYLAYRLDASRILLVLGESSSQPGDPDFQAELLHLPWCSTINLGLFSAEEVAELAGADGTGASPADLHELSGGNPLLVRALLEDHRAGAAGTETGPVLPGELFTEAVEICLYRSDAAVRWTAWAASILGDEASRVRIAEVLSSPVQVVDGGLTALAEMGLLLPDGRFRHEAVRAAVKKRVNHYQRPRLEARSAWVLHEHGATTTVVAAHLVQAQRITAPWVLPTLREGAERALAENDVTLALDCLRVARDLCTDEAASLEIKTAIVSAAWRVNPRMAEHYLPELAEAAAQGRLGARDARVVTGCLLWFGRTEDALRVLEVLIEADTSRKRSAAGFRVPHELDLVRLWMVYGYPGLPGIDRQSAIEASLEPLTPMQSPPLRASALLAAVVCEEESGEIVVRAEQALQTTPFNDNTMTVIVAALISLILVDQLSTADSWCRKLEKDAVTHRSPVWQAILVAVRALVEIRMGRLAEAAESARSALELVPAQGWGVPVTAPLSALIYAESLLGHPDKAAAFLGVPVPEAAYATPGGVMLLWARGHFHLASGNPYAALDDFYACGELMSDLGIELHALVQWRTDAAEAYLELGDAQRARELVEEQMALLGPGRTWMRGVSLRVLAGACEPKKRLPLLQEAVDIFRDQGHRLKEAQALEELGRAHYKLGHEKQARSLNRKAQRLMRELGMRQQARPSTPAGTARDTASAEQENALGLSDAELRVASLAARSQSNREIAEELFITLSTVEQHMTRVLRKLGVRSRGDLSAKLLEIQAEEEALTR
ncbi:LuxR C-terminal-related transcriptional regulator [Actinocorallia longicatena]|uniref:LuxR C-terminal-related transcriptional regulator n=1 Tax=Actinocorallia longicatena TaxID=111803 RepID=A0ABP6QFN8_9ACTN